MVATDSRQKGILKPLDGVNTVDPVDILREWVAGCSDLPLKNVRRRWAVSPGTRPALNEAWAVVGVTSVISHGTPWQEGRRGDLDDAESGDITRVSDQTLLVDITFMGDGAFMRADTFRETARLGQTNEYLKARGLTLQAVEEAQHVPDFFNGHFIDRVDVRVHVGRRVVQIGRAHV